MIAVSSDLAKYIKQHYPSACIPQTCREKSKSKRKKKYVEETPKILKLIDAYNHQLKIIETYGEK